MNKEPSEVVIFMDNFDSPEKDVVLPGQTSPEPNKDDGGKDSRFDYGRAESPDANISLSFKQRNAMSIPEKLGEVGKKRGNDEGEESDDDDDEEAQEGFEVALDLGSDFVAKNVRSTSELYLKHKKPKKSAPKQRRRSAPVDRRRSGMRRRSSRGISGGDLPGGRRRRRSSQKAAKRTLGESEAMVILRPLQLTHTKRVPLGRHEIKSFKSVQRTEVERHKSSKGFTMVLAEYTFDHDSKMFFVHGERKMKKILEQEEEDKKSKEEKQSQDATSFSLDSDFESDEEDNAFEPRHNAMVAYPPSTLQSEIPRHVWLPGYQIRKTSDFCATTARQRGRRTIGR
ncbi:uncharacterized protein LOC142338631 isoform X3 [Convolutriloba macropyga]|uniref:uncharacterized protein LOC142338631 isoform X3 n=1 Tax=Convolutriloba macropyga TaxID=536237 RepID=UPI003F521A03